MRSFVAASAGSSAANEGNVVKAMVVLSTCSMCFVTLAGACGTSDAPNEAATGASGAAGADNAGEGGSAGASPSLAGAGAAPPLIEFDTAGASGVGCAEETRALPYAEGLEVVSQLGMRVTLLESRPAPHVGDHTWTLRIVEADASPVLGASVKVSPFMPDHHHGSPLVPSVAEQENGVYVADPVELIMPGYWRTTIRVTTDSWTDSVAVPLCIE